MIHYLIWCAVLFIAFIVGTFGFCQIIGTVKYFSNFTVGRAIFTITLWLIILAAGAIIVCVWLNDYLLPLSIAYGIAFILSFRTKPD